jgi:hypothetical protein
MAAVSVACPSCAKTMRVPPEILGKKIRCKSCQHIFVAQDEEEEEIAIEVVGKQKNPPAKKKPVEEVNSDTEMARDPYALTKDHSDLPRCPFCAKELAEETAIICLNCGYNTRTRIRSETKAVYQPSFGEWAVWLAPGILAFLMFAGCITAIVFFILKMSIWLEGSILEAEDSKPDARKWNVNPGIVTLWSSVACAFLGWKMLKIAIKRLCIDYKPTERKIDEDK